MNKYSSILLRAAKEIQLLNSVERELVCKVVICGFDSDTCKAAQDLIDLNNVLDRTTNKVISMLAGGNLNNPASVVKLVIEELAV